MSNRRRVLGIVAAVALAVIGTFALVSYVQGAEDRAIAGEKVVNVYVASQAIPAGSAGANLTNKVTLEKIPAKVRADGAVANLKQVDGLVTSIALLPGEQLAMSRFQKAGSATVQRTPTGTKIPLGWYQIAVSLEPEQALGGTVKAGERVAIFASVSGGIVPNGPTTGVIARNAIVTNVQIDGDQGDEASGDEVTTAPSGKFIVTLAVPEEEANRIVYSTTQGDVWLATEPSVG